MARSALPTLEINPHYMYLVSAKLNSETDGQYTLLGQLKAIDVNGTSDSKEFTSVGRLTKKKVSGSIVYDVTVTTHFDDDVSEIALMMGSRKPAGTGGWVGTESITFSPSVAIDFKIEGYNGTGTDATLTTSEHLESFQANGIKLGIDSEGDSRTLEISGSIDSYAMTPAAALGAG